MKTAKGNQMNGMRYSRCDRLQIHIARCCDMTACDTQRDRRDDGGEHHCFGTPAESFGMKTATTRHTLKISVQCTHSHTRLRGTKQIEKLGALC